MNEPEKIRAAQKARNLERQAEIANTREAWMLAAVAWKKAENKEAAERCGLAADECKR